MADSRTQYVTLVEHSGYARARKPSFRRGIEIAYIHTKAEIARVNSVNGFLIEQDKIDPAAFEDAVGYPPGVETMAPQARGSFAAKRLDGLRIYIPVVADIEDVKKITKQ